MSVPRLAGPRIRCTHTRLPFRRAEAHAAVKLHATEGTSFVEWAELGAMVREIWVQKSQRQVREPAQPAIAT